jgi:hypothetical protein
LIPLQPEASTQKTANGAQRRMRQILSIGRV